MFELYEYTNYLLIKRWFYLSVSNHIAGVLKYLKKHKGNSYRNSTWKYKL